VGAVGRRSVFDADEEATTGEQPAQFHRPTGKRAVRGVTPRHRDPIPIPAPRLNAERRRRPLPSLHLASRPIVGRRCRNCLLAAVKQTGGVLFA